MSQFDLDHNWVLVYMYLDFALSLHQLQFGLSQFQLHLPQLVLQTLLLLVRLLGPSGWRRGNSSPHTTLFVEKAAALLAALHFGLEKVMRKTETKIEKG